MRCSCSCGRNLSWKRGRTAQHAVDLRQAYPFFEAAIKFADAGRVQPDPACAPLWARGVSLEQRLLSYAHGEASADVLPSLSELSAWRREAQVTIERVGPELELAAQVAVWLSQHG